MKYLIQNKKEFAITVGVFVMTTINIIKAIMSKEITQECIVAFVLAGFTLLGWFYNMPTSEENCRHTGEMRLEKHRPDDGENFFDEAEEIDGGEMPSIEVTTNDGELIASIGTEDVIVKDGYDVKGGEIDD